MPLGLKHTDAPKLLKHDSVPGSVTSLLFPLVHGRRPCGGTAVHGGGTSRPEAGQGKLPFLLKPTGQETSLSTLRNLSLVTCAFASSLPGTERTIWDAEENHHSCCDPFWQCQKKKQEWIGQWEKTICLLLSLNRYSLSTQLCQCKTIAFLPSLVFPLPPQGHAVDGSAEHSSALCKTSRP